MVVKGGVMTKEEEKRGPKISIETTYGNYISNGPPVDEAITLEAFLIASALFSWTFRAQGIFHWLIDYVKVTFCDIQNGAMVNFKLTLKPYSDPPAHVLEVTWNKGKHYETLTSPRYDTIENCVSKDQVIDGIKHILHDFIVRLSKERIKDGQYLEKLSQNIKERM